MAVDPAGQFEERIMADLENLKKDLWAKMAHSPFVMVGLEGHGHSEPLTAAVSLLPTLLPASLSLRSVDRKVL